MLSAGMRTSCSWEAMLNNVLLSPARRVEKDSTFFTRCFGRTVDQTGAF